MVHPLIVKCLAFSKKRHGHRGKIVGKVGGSSVKREADMSVLVP
jgi:hypothetical protein